MFNGDVVDSDLLVEQLIREYDQTSMPLPDIEDEPHLLISKVRKHYMEYLIKLLSENYETNQQLLNKNIYLPSAIWRCAKQIEMAAAQTCMVVQIYRKNIVSVVKEVMNDTKRKKLNKKLFETLHKPPKNEKRTQTKATVGDKNCECVCKKKAKRLKGTVFPKNEENTATAKPEPMKETEQLSVIPVIINSQVMTTQNKPVQEPDKHTEIPNQMSTGNSRLSVDSQESDELMLQLERLFQSDPNDEDLFDSTLFDFTDSITSDNPKLPQSQVTNMESDAFPPSAESSVPKDPMLHTQTLEERLASMAGLIDTEKGSPTVTSTTEKPHLNSPQPRVTKSISKWTCEEYFLKARFLEMLDGIGDQSRKKLAEIKELLVELFGEDSDNEGVLSPLEETPDFILSCKERIAPWVVKLLTPYYLKGRIRGKTLFKALAKHLIKLICQCSRYPQQYEVQSFVMDFMQTHSMIRTEADFKEFRIENI